MTTVHLAHMGEITKADTMAAEAADVPDCAERRHRREDWRRRLGLAGLSATQIALVENSDKIERLLLGLLGDKRQREEHVWTEAEDAERRTRSWKCSCQPSGRRGEARDGHQAARSDAQTLAAVKAGYEAAKGASNPYLATSTCSDAWFVGRFLSAHGWTCPTRARPTRGAGRIAIWCAVAREDAVFVVDDGDVWRA